MPGFVKIDRRLPEGLREQTGSGADVQSPEPTPSYYDISMLKAPVWEGPLIGTYFWLGGLSGGAYLVGRMAEIFAGDAGRDVSRAGTTVSMLADIPCAPLLIADLGDWSRFHHMLRVWKPQSPMNFGSWVVTGFSAACAAGVVREWLRAENGRPTSVFSQIADKSLAVFTDAAGVPLALLMISYTGVLCSGTATPVWSRNKWLAPLFAASAIGNGASAISLAMHFMRKIHPREAERMHGVLDKVETAAHLAELILRQQYFKSLGPLAKPYTSGGQTKYMMTNLACTIGSEALRYAPLRGRAKTAARIGSAALGVLGGLALKYGILEAGAPSAKDPKAARYANSRQRRLEDADEPRKHPFPAPKAQPLMPPGASGAMGT